MTDDELYKAMVEDPEFYRTTTTAASTAPPITIDSILQLKRELDERFPPSTVLTRIDVNRLAAAFIGSNVPTFAALKWFGVPLIIDDELDSNPVPVAVFHFADGSKRKISI